MAAGQITVLNISLLKLLTAGFDLDSDTFKAVLTTKDQPLTAAFVGTSGQALYSDLTDEVVGAGYTAGGADVPNATASLSGSVVTLNADPTTWASASLTAKYAVLCKVSGGVPTDILAFFDMETTDPDGRSSNGGDLVINFTAGLFTQTRV